MVDPVAGEISQPDPDGHLKALSKVASEARLLVIVGHAFATVSLCLSNTSCNFGRTWVDRVFRPADQVKNPDEGRAVIVAATLVSAVRARNESIPDNPSW